MNASFTWFPVNKRSPGVETDPLKFIEVPCAPVAPVGPASPATTNLQEARVPLPEMRSIVIVMEVPEIVVSTPSIKFVVTAVLTSLALVPTA
jgi:hypothetical protein